MTATSTLLLIALGVALVFAVGIWSEVSMVHEEVTAIRKHLEER